MGSAPASLLEAAARRAAHTQHDDAQPPLTVAEVYARHAAFVWRVVRRRGVPDAVAEDLMHEVFLVVHRRLGEYDGRASLPTWLFHLTRGVISNWQRSQRRERSRIAELAPPFEGDVDPEQQATRAQAQVLVHTFLAGLDDAKRDVFELVELEGQAVPDVARSLGINLNTAYSRLRLARHAFAQATARWRADRGTP